MNTEDKKEELKEELKQVLSDLRNKNQKERRGGFIPDPTRQLALRLQELEKRIEHIEARLVALDNEVSVFRPIGGENF